MRLSQFIDFINRDPIPTQEKRDEVYTHIEIGEKELKARKKYRKAIKAKIGDE